MDYIIIKKIFSEKLTLKLVYKVHFTRYQLSFYLEGIKLA